LGFSIQAAARHWPNITIEAFNCTRMDVHTLKLDGNFLRWKKMAFRLASGFHTTKLADTLPPQHMPANGITFAHVNIYCFKSLSALLKHFNTLREGHIDLEGNGDCYV
jgi:hypothetical protein